MRTGLNKDFCTGDIVGIYAHGKPLLENGLSGIVVRKDSLSVTIVFDQLDDAMDVTVYDGALLVIKLANDVTYLRMKR